ncbi:MAG: hypothetical protein AAFU53_04470 [Cyanobacteria bacterium J06632_3]
MSKKVWAGVGLGSAIALLLGGQAVASHVAAKEVDKAIAEFSDVADIEYRKVNFSLLQQNTTIKDVVIKPISQDKPITVNEMVLYNYKESNDVPTHIKLAVNGISVDSSMLVENAEIFSELGYEGELAANFATEYSYQEDERTLTLKQLSLGADDVGEVNMSFHFSNASLDENAIAALPYSLLSMEFHTAQLTYEDKSFVKRLFETTAAAEGISLEDAKAAAIEGLQKEITSSGNAPSDEFIQEITNFVNNPDSFSITLNPENPVPLTSLAGVGGAEDIIELLNVKFES